MIGRLRIGSGNGAARYPLEFGIAARLGEVI